MAGVSCDRMETSTSLRDSLVAVIAASAGAPGIISVST